MIHDPAIQATFTIGRVHLEVKTVKVASNQASSHLIIAFRVTRCNCFQLIVYTLGNAFDYLINGNRGISGMRVFPSLIL